MNECRFVLHSQRWNLSLWRPKFSSSSQIFTEVAQERLECKIVFDMLHKIKEFLHVIYANTY